MRLLFLLMLLIGAGIAFVYPVSTAQFSGHDIGTFRAYDVADGFQQVPVDLDSKDTPVLVSADVIAAIPREGVPAGQSVLTVTAAVDGRTVLAETLDLSRAEPREDSPQTAQRIYRLSVGSIAVESPASYTFVVGPGDAEGVHLNQVDLILRGSSVPYRDSAVPIGLSVLAIGFIGFVNSLRRRRTAPAGKAEPPKPRWGRGGPER
ncbi:MAG: hypothetical protein KF914_09000 [Rhizobiaceae bacterium]|nr:hypothetical protein [Rhizobiaceae bacterium]